MKKLIVFACLGLISALCITWAVKRPAAAVAGNAASAAQPAPRVIVHEWGTFTGFAGSDGVHLPFNTQFNADLPDFVMNRMKHASQFDPQLKIRMAFIKAGGAPALQRMETPVIYFYADAPADLNVRVDFPQGLLTEFYPPVKGMGPDYGAGYGEFISPDAKKATPGSGPQTRPAESFLDWGRVRIVPHPAGNEGKLVPAVIEPTHYGIVRDTDANLVQFTDAKGTRHEERFLFYRGLGNFTLPVTLVAQGKDTFELKNSSAAPIPAAFLIRIDGEGHKRARFARFDNIAGNRTLTFPAGAAAGDLAEAITQTLISNGLYEKEARAMVQTWKDNWLDEPGTRVLYIVPRPVTDALLPLRIQPAPDQTVRVLVGRIDVLTPEQESQLRSMMQIADTTGKVSDEDARMVRSLGRFQYAAFDRMIKLVGEPGRQQVGKLRQAMSQQASAQK